MSRGLYGFVEVLCKLSEAYDEAIVSQWGDTAIVIEPGDDPFTICREVKNGSHEHDGGEPPRSA